MADTIRRRLAAPDPYLDDALEPVRACVRRTRLRALFRRGWSGETGLAAGLASGLDLPIAAVRDAFAAPFAGVGWATLEAASGRLRRQLVRSSEVLRAQAEAEQVLHELAAHAAADMLAA